jgi:hypothetical protein
MQRPVELGAPAEINVFPEGNPSLPGSRPSGSRASNPRFLPKKKEKLVGDGHHPQEDCGGAGPLMATSSGQDQLSTIQCLPAEAFTHRAIPSGPLE